MRYELEGNGRNLIVDDGGVKIINTTMMGRAFEKTIPFSQIVSVEYSEPGRITGGYLYFQTIGSTGTKVKLKVELAKDDNAVFFMKKHNELALSIKAAVEDVITKAKSSEPATSPSGGADELLKYKQLLDAGVLTAEEFEKKKAQILGI